MGLAAGKLDREVRLERATFARDAFNNPTATVWTVIATVPASKVDVRDSERVAAQEVGADITTRFQTHWLPAIADLNPKDRLVCEGRTYRIVAVKELGRREGLEITAAARVD